MKLFLRSAVTIVMVVGSFVCNPAWAGQHEGRASQALPAPRKAVERLSRGASKQAPAREAKVEKAQSASTRKSGSMRLASTRANERKAPTMVKAPEMKSLEQLRAENIETRKQYATVNERYNERQRALTDAMFANDEAYRRIPAVLQSEKEHPSAVSPGYDPSFRLTRDYLDALDKAVKADPTYAASRERLRNVTAEVKQLHAEKKGLEHVLNLQFNEIQKTLTQ